MWFSRLALIGRTTGQPFAEIDGIVRETLDHLAALPLRSPPSEFPIILLAAPGEGARLVSATWGPLGPRLRLIETALPDRPTPTPTPTPDFGIGAWVFSALACHKPGRGIGYSHRASAAIARRRAYTRHLPGVAASLALAAAAWAVDATLHRQASSLHAASLAAAVAARQPALESWLRRADQGTRGLGRTQAMLAADAALLRWADRSAPGLPARVAQVLARHPAIELDRFGWREPGAPAESPADSPAASLSGRVRAESGGPRQARRMFEEFIADLGRSMVPLEVEPATRPFTWPSARNGPGAGWNDPGFAVYLGPR